MKTVLIGGQERPVVFKMSTIAKFLRSEGIDSNNLLGIDLYASMNLCFYGLADGARKSNQKVDFKKEDVIDWLDEGGFGEGSAYTQIMAVFGDSMKGLSSVGEEVLSPEDEAKIEEEIKN